MSPEQENGNSQVVFDLSDETATITPLPPGYGEVALTSEEKEVARQIAREFSFSRHQSERVVARIRELTKGHTPPSS